MNPKTAQATAFLSIKTQFDNLGDALINRELCRLLSARMRTYVDFSRAPTAFQRSMRVEDFHNLIVLREHGFIHLLAKMLKLRLTGHDCYFFLNPGGLGGRKKPLKNLLAASIYNVILGLLRLIGVRICHTGISFDPMGTPERWVTMWRRYLLHSFTVRDQISFNYLRDIGMSADSIVPDLSFNLCNQSILKNTKRNVITFSFRFDGKASYQQIEVAVLQVMTKLGSTFEYLFLAQVARDEAGMRKLHAACNNGSVLTSLLICHDDIGKLLTLHDNCKAIYSNRLHALLLAAYAGAAPYALLTRGTQPKIEGLFNDLALSPRLCFIDDTNFSVPDITPPELDLLAGECAKLQTFFNDLLEPNNAVR